MTLKLEDGTGGDALITLAGFNEYCEARGLDVATFDAVEKEQAIRRASIYISTNWTYQGYKIGGRAQALAFPRSGMVDLDGYSIDFNTIPREAEWGTAEAAFYDLQNPDSPLSPTVKMTDRVRSEQVGPLRVEYAQTDNTLGAARPVLLILGDLLKPLFASQQSNRITARADRG